MERTSLRKTCQKAQPSVEEDRLYNGYDDDDDDETAKHGDVIENSPVKKEASYVNGRSDKPW